MPKARSPEQLAEKRYVTVILRLLLDRQGRLVQGEVVNTASQVQGRFAGWRGMSRTLRTWVSTHATDEESS